MAALTTDDARNRQIADDVAAEVRRGTGTALVVSDRVAHCETLAKLIEERGIDVSILTGKISGEERGKIVQAVQDENLKVLPSTDITTVINDKSTYLITGGCSGLGLSIARRLADVGAKHLILMSRSGPKSEEDKQLVNEIEAAGVQVYDARADVSNKEQVTDVFLKANSKVVRLIDSKDILESSSKNKIE